MQYPNISDRALLCVSPTTLLQGLLRANGGDLRTLLLTKANLTLILNTMVVRRNLKSSKDGSIRSLLKRVSILQCFYISLKRFVVERIARLGESISKCITYPSRPRNNVPCAFTYGQSHLPLPLIDEGFFGPDGLDIRRFTEAIKRNCDREQIEILDANVMRRAVAEFARQPFPSASHAMRMQMVNQVRDF